MSIYQLLKLEGLGVLLLSILAYSMTGTSWLLFVLLFLVPDIAMFGYLVNKRFGAATYNVVHSYLLPMLLLSVGVLLSHSLGAALALIWFAHIGLDRMLGYGLKYPDGFKHTHLNHG